MRRYEALLKKRINSLNSDIIQLRCKLLICPAHLIAQTELDLERLQDEKEIAEEDMSEE